MPEVRARRVYEEPQASDGTRVLVDRLWPRGLAKDAAHIDEWLKTVAPSDELRHWYGHDPAKFAEFRRRYSDELRDQERAGALRHLRELAATGTLTLLTATRDLEHSQAADLAERLRDWGEERGGDPACWLNRVCPKCGEMAETEPPATCPRCHTQIP
jgi:uncharacterized protein YeaO (DUF488 family)/ribosomal protein S27AE